MSPEMATIIRWIHVASASAWFGEVLVINVILIPALSQMVADSRKEFLNTVFPRVFKLASVLSATAVFAGLTLLLIKTDGDLSLLFDSRWGLSILVGGSLGLALTFFHFFMEQQLASRIGVGDCNISPENVEDAHGKLKIVPRIGLLIITAVLSPC